MFFRCAGCLVPSRITEIQLHGCSRGVYCGACGWSWHVQPREELGPEDGDHFRQTRRFAEENDLDLPSAYSVLLGIMSPEQAQALRYSRVSALQLQQEEQQQQQQQQQQRQADDLDYELAAAGSSPESTAFQVVEFVAARPSPEPTALQIVQVAAARPSAEPDFDPAFAGAIRAGHLTVRQAIMRGDREAYAQYLIQRHSLTVQEAYRVTDNRSRLSDVLRPKEQAASSHVRGQAPSSSGTSPVLSWTVLALTAVGLVALISARSNDPGSLQRPKRPARSHAARGPAAAGQQVVRQRPPIVPVVYTVDTESQLTQVIGPDPPSVLFSFCAQEQNTSVLLPHALAPVLPPDAALRIGVVRNRESTDQLSSVRIWLNPRNGRWTIGNGTEPILLEPLQRIPENATLF